MIGGNDEEKLPGPAGRKVAGEDSGGSGDRETGPEKLNGGAEVGSHRKQESEPGMYRAERGGSRAHHVTSEHYVSTFISPGTYPWQENSFYGK